MAKVGFPEKCRRIAEQIDQHSPPQLIAMELGFLISDSLKSGEISVYEGYLLNSERLRFRRRAYSEMAWDIKPQISDLLGLLNQKLMAQIYEDARAADLYRRWATEAYKENREKRSHEIADSYENFIAGDNAACLERLSELRRGYDRLNSNFGPFHVELFPFEYFSPEDYLLGRHAGGAELDKTVSEAVQDCIVSICVHA